MRGKSATCHNNSGAKSLKRVGLLIYFLEKKVRVIRDGTVRRIRLCHPPDGGTSIIKDLLT